jgi:peptide/nickel transport system permease protein
LFGSDAPRDIRRCDEKRAEEVAAVMWRFIIKRVLLGIVIIVLGSLVAYAVIRCLPTSFVEQMARERSQLPGSKSYSEWLADLNKFYGMDTDIITGFLRWGNNALSGAWGDSWIYNKPVTAVYNDVIGYTVALNIITLILQIVLCIPLGILAARKQYSKTDYTITVVALACISLPTFFLATILKYIFAIRLGVLELYGIAGRFYQQLSPFGKFLDVAKHMILPILTLTMLNLGGLMRFTRTNMLEVLSSDYIRTARAKGVPERRVVYYHAFRNTLIPLISYMSYLIPSLFAGSLITETLFQIPGIGWTAYQGIIGGDIPFTMFYLVFMTVLTQVSLMFADILYAVVDPRVRIN